MTTAEPIKIAIDAQITPGRHGGIVQAVLGLVHALGQLDDSDDQYVIIGHWHDPDWLRKYMGPNQRLTQQSSPRQANDGEAFKRVLGPLRPAVRKLWRTFVPAPSQRLWPEVPISDGYYESLGCDVIHFPYQSFTVCSLPS